MTDRNVTKFYLDLCHQPKVSERGGKYKGFNRSMTFATDKLDRKKAEMLHEQIVSYIEQQLEALNGKS